MASSVRSPIRSKSQVSEVMSRISSKHTEPEQAFRKALRRVGVRSFRICDSSLPGKPDIVLPRKKAVVFVDGDFWHGNQYRLRGFDSVHEQLLGVNNSHYWSEKISRNVDRDFRNTEQLLKSGWRGLRFWERDIHREAKKCAHLTLQEAKAMDRAAFSCLPSRTVVELFAGTGLVRLALDRGGWTTVFANDNDLQKFEMYRENFGADGFE